MARKETIQTTEEYEYTAVFTQDLQDGGFVVTFPALPGCVTQGDTLEEARAMAVDALEAYLDSFRQLKEPIPTEPATLSAAPIVERVRASLKMA